MSEWPRDPESRFRTVDDMTPYFRSLARQKRICPKCHQAALTVEPTLNPNIGADRCPKCRYFMAVCAPEAAMVPNDWVRPRKRECQIVRFADISRNANREKR